MSEKKYFWADPKGSFGRTVKFGDEMPGNLDKDRIKDLLEKGKISDKKPASITEKQLNELEDLKAQVSKLKEKLAEKDREIAKLKAGSQNGKA